LLLQLLLLKLLLLLLLILLLKLLLLQQLLLLLQLLGLLRRTGLLSSGDRRRRHVSHHGRLIWWAHRRTHRGGRGGSTGDALCVLLLQTSNVGGYWRSLLRHELLHPRLLERLRLLLSALHLLGYVKVPHRRSTLSLSLLSLLSLLALLPLLTLLPRSTGPSLASLTLLPSSHRPSLRLQRLHRRIHLLRRPLLSPLSRRLRRLRELLQHRKLSGVDSAR
jgi:hypothetical protein